MDDLRQVIEESFERRGALTPESASGELRAAVEQAVQMLDAGQARVAEPRPDGQWQVNQWLKKAVLLSFRLVPAARMDGGDLRWFDKVPLKFSECDDADFHRLGARVAPGAVVRRGAFVGRDVVLMPSFVNIGAFVDEGTMVDAWATVGSCAQVGKRVHLSGGAGVGGVLEPLQAAPTVIEDDCFIGARSEIVEGVVVGRGAVVSMGVFVGQSTRIYDRQTGEVSYGKIPPGAVVVPGSLPAPDGKHSLQCAVIVKRVDEKTRAKTAINELLRAD